MLTLRHAAAQFRDRHWNVQLPSSYDSIRFLSAAIMCTSHMHCCICSRLVTTRLAHIVSKRLRNTCIAVAIRAQFYAILAWFEERSIVRQKINTFFALDAERRRTTAEQLSNVVRVSISWLTCEIQRESQYCDTCLSVELQSISHITRTSGIGL